ncbi:MAG: sigma-70 family RNA polymerase sigma factor [bacterium]|nr:sigma-70 family RNA polymerase sigma factor [bacterium]
MKTPMLEPTEVEALIARCLSGEQTGFAVLYDTFAPGVVRLCYSLLLNHHDAEDVAQETFVYAFKNLRRYDPRLSAFKTWLFTIAICRCRNMYRRSRPQSVDLSSLLQHELPAPRSETPEAAFARTSAKEALEKALLNLSPRLREAVVLRYGHGLTYREIADIMDCPPKTAESRVRLAHEALRGMLHPVGQGLLEELWNG